MYVLPGAQRKKKLALYIHARERTDIFDIPKHDIPAKPSLAL